MLVIVRIPAFVAYDADPTPPDILTPTAGIVAACLRRASYLRADKSPDVIRADQADLTEATARITGEAAAAIFGLAPRMHTSLGSGAAMPGALNSSIDDWPYNKREAHLNVDAVHLTRLPKGRAAIAFDLVSV